MHVIRENGLSGVYQILAIDIAAIKCVLHVIFTWLHRIGVKFGVRVYEVKLWGSVARGSIHKRIYYIECCSQIFGSGNGAVYTIIRNQMIKRKECFPSELVSNVAIYYHMLSKAQLESELSVVYRNDTFANVKFWLC
jgi:hypothetical protein